MRAGRTMRNVKVTHNTKKGSGCMNWNWVVFIIVVAVAAVLVLIGVISIVAVSVSSSGSSVEALECLNDFQCISTNQCVETSCQEGKCVETPIRNCCTKDDECESSICYNTYCDPKSFTCKLHPPVNGTRCDDYDFCTDNDVCVGYVCKGTERSCESDNICSLGTCKEGIGCVYTSVMDGHTCYTNDKCHSNNQCINGICTLGPVKDCSHFDTQCSRGVCDSTSGECVRVGINEDNPCDDSLECTVDDTCSNSQCIGKEKKCYDNNPCTINKCVEGIGCMLKYESYNMTCSSTCVDSSDCPAGYVCADGTCVTLDYAGSQIRFIDYEIEVCPAGGHRLVMDFVLDSHPISVGNDTRYIVPRTLADITANNQPLGFIDQKTSMQKLIIAGDISRTAFTLTTACQNVTQANCDTIFSMRRYEFFVELYHCLSVSPNEPNCIDTNMAVSASIALSISDCTLFDQYQHIPLYGLGVLYAGNDRYTGIVDDTAIDTGDIYVTVGIETPVYTNPNFVALTTNFRMCRAKAGHYLRDCVSGKDPKCLVTGCYNWDPNDSPVLEYHDIMVDRRLVSMAKTSWQALSCYNEDEYNSASSIICATNKCPNTPNGLALPWVAAMDDGFRFSTLPLQVNDFNSREWTFDIQFKLYECNNTVLRSGNNIFHNTVTLVI